MANLNVGITATDKTGRAFNAVNKNVESLKTGFGKLGGVIAGAFAIGGITAFTNKMLDFADRVHKVSLQVGLGAEALQKFQFAGEQSGIEAEKLNKSFQKLAENVGKATKGSKAQIEAFETLGVQFTDTAGKALPLEEIILKTADGIKNLKDPTMEASVATKLFGGAGVELLEFLRLGETGLKLYGDELESVGGVLSQNAIDNSAKFNDEINKLSKTFRVIFGEVILPIVNATFLGIKRLFYLAKTGDPFSLMEKSTKVLNKDLKKLLAENDKLVKQQLAQKKTLEDTNLKYYQQQNVKRNILETDQKRNEIIKQIDKIQEVLNVRTGVTVIDYAEIDKNVAKAKENLEKTEKTVTKSAEKTKEIKNNTKDIAIAELEIVQLKGENDTRYSNLIEHTLTYDSELNNVKNSWQNITGKVDEAKNSTEDLNRFFKETGTEISEVIEPSIRTVDEIASNYKKSSEDLSRFFNQQGTILESKIEPKIINIDSIASDYKSTLDEIANKFLPKEVTEYEKAIPVARTLDELAEARRKKLMEIANKFTPKQVTEAEKAIPINRSLDEIANDYLNKIRDQTHQFKEVGVALTEEERIFNSILSIAEKTNSVTSKWSKSLSGTKTQLKDLATTFTPIVQAIGTGLSAVGDFAGRNIEGIAQAGGKSGQRALNVGKQFAEKGVEAGIMALVLSNEKVQEALAKVFDALFQLIDPILDLLAPVLESLVEIIVELKPLFELLIPPIRELLKLLRPVIEVLKFVARVLTKVGQFVSALLTPFKILTEAINFLAGPLKSLENAIKSIAKTFSFGGGGGGGGLLGGKVIPGFLADGGPARSNEPYIVGEKGPELFVPNRNGIVVPNEELGGGQTIVNVYLDMEGQVKLPLHQYISNVVNNAERQGDQQLATVLAG